MTGRAVHRGRSGRVAPYEGILRGVVELLRAARRSSVRSVSVVMTATFWEIGRRIVEFEQHGQQRAPYGTTLLKALAHDLVSRVGRGFGWRNLYLMRTFYLAYPEILHTVSAKSRAARVPPDLATQFPLPWSHYVRLIGVEDCQARRFYEQEALRGGWSVRQLERQIDSLFYERTALSKNKAAMLHRGSKRRRTDSVVAEEEIKDPFILEFLGLKDEYSESDLEDALVRRLEEFLLELGADFTFAGRQKRLRIADEWFRVDLLLYHRRLRCLVVIDLKLGKFTHADAGQMHMYLNYAREHWTLPGENPPIGVILCSRADASIARYVLSGLDNRILAARYRTTMPGERALAEELGRARRALDRRRGVRSVDPPE